jgi:hypothetical protein
VRTRNDAGNTGHTMIAIFGEDIGVVVGVVAVAIETMRASEKVLNWLPFYTNETKVNGYPVRAYHNRQDATGDGRIENIPE